MKLNPCQKGAGKTPCGKVEGPSAPWGPDNCYLCWRWPQKLAGATRPPLSLPVVIPPRTPCLHLGKEIGRTPCLSCTGTVDVKVFACDVHGRTTLSKPVPDIACCETPRCPQWEPSEPVRHLLYYVYPKSGNGIWQRNLAQLVKRIDQFDGRRIIAVAQGSQCDPIDVVRGSLWGYRCEIVELPHDPDRREGTAWPQLWGQLKTERNGWDITFWGHAKGVSRPVNDGVSVHEWTDAIYRTLLDDPRRIAEVLRDKPIAGSFRKGIKGFPDSKSTWHYSGGMYWVRNRDFFGRPWKKIEDIPFATEAAPGVLYRPDEAGEVFFGREEAYNLYDLGFWQREVRPALEQWLAKRKVPT